MMFSLLAKDAHVGDRVVLDPDAFMWDSRWIVLSVEEDKVILKSPHSYLPEIYTGLETKLWMWDRDYKYLEPVKYNLKEVKLDRYGVTTLLNNCIMGLIIGSKDGLIDHVIRQFKIVFGVDLPKENVSIVIYILPNPKRKCWSIHIRYDGEDYESVIVNQNYYTGYEL
jgi:hypothetical protein